MNVIRAITNNSGLVLILFGALAYVAPQLFSWVKGTTQSVILGLLVFFMGFSVPTEEYKQIAKTPLKLLFGGACQYTIMPLSAVLLCVVFDPPTPVAIGIVLVACCPGAAASNLISHLAGGDVAFSISITMLTTLLSPLLTPILVYFVLRSNVDVPVGSMIRSIIIIVLIPLILSISIRTIAGDKKIIDRVNKFSPLLSVLGLGFIVGGAVTVYAGYTVSNSALIGILLAVALNIMGYLGGWFAALAAHCELKDQATLSIEVGMQNAGLATSLAMTYFPDAGEAAVIAAFACAWFAITGTFVAKVFVKAAKKEKR